MCSPRQLPVCCLKGEEGDEKEMGDLGSGEVEQLDRNMWAPDENEDKQKVSFLLSLNYLQIGEAFLYLRCLSGASRWTRSVVLRVFVKSHIMIHM